MWEHKRERWTREDARGIHRVLCRSALAALELMFHAFRGRKLKSDIPRDRSFDTEVQDAQEKVRLYGSSVVVEAAEKIRECLVRTGKMREDRKSTRLNS